MSNETQTFVQSCVDNARAMLSVQGKMIASDDPAETIQDLLADLMHYCDATKLDFNDILKHAKTNYVVEKDKAEKELRSQP